MLFDQLPKLLLLAAFPVNIQGKLGNGLPRLYHCFYNPVNMFLRSQPGGCQDRIGPAVCHWIFQFIQAAHRYGINCRCNALVFKKLLLQQLILLICSCNIKIHMLIHSKGILIIIVPQDMVFVSSSFAEVIRVNDNPHPGLSCMP